MPIIYMVISTIIFSLPTINGSGIGNKEEEWIEIETKQMYVSLTLHWMPVLNPLISIITNMPYRRALLKMAKQIIPANQITPTGPSGAAIIVT